MIRVLISFVFACLLGSTVNLYAGQLDSLRMQALSSRLEEYFTILKHESIEVQKKECDFLIESSSDSLVRQYVAIKIYEHYADSPVMGAEAVALHVADRWFIPGFIRMNGPQDLMKVRVFAEFNRQSQVGMKAPTLKLLSPEGEAKELYGTPSGRYSVLLFYDADCPKCRIESVKLRNMFSLGKYPVDVYAVYVGDDFHRWEDYRRTYLDSENVSVVHLWDPELESDFQRKYGVITTPGIFLVDGNGSIRGRKLDADALKFMLDDLLTPKELVYGSEESQMLFDGILGMEPSAEDIADLAAMLASRTLDQGDTLMFRQLAGDFLYYLAPKTGEEFKKGTEDFIDRYVLSEDSVWKSPDDSMKVVGFAMIMDDLLSKAQVGNKVPDLRLPGKMLSCSRSVCGSYRLRRLGGSTGFILFYTEGCDVCDAEKKAAERIVCSYPGTRVFMINVDELMSESPSLAASVLDSFDLTSLPYIIQTDRKGVVIRRYISLQNF